MGQPLVSIVVPTYNRAGFVETAIMSVLEQDYSALELIVVDDGSSDETPAVLERIAEHADPQRFRWLRHENAGQAESINRGFEQAGGELLGYLSSDDYLLPGAIARLVAAAEQHPDAAVAYSSFYVIDEADQRTDTVVCLQHTFVDSLRWSLCIPGVAALMRRSCYERIGGWDPSLRYAPDFDWWLKAGDVEFVLVPEPGGAWRAHGGSITMGDFGLEEVRKRLDERLRMLDRIYARPDLPAQLQAVRREAYATTLIELGSMLAWHGRDHGEPSHGEPRFIVEDRLGQRYSQNAAAGMKDSLLWSERQRRSADARAKASEYESGQLEQAAVALQATAEQRAKTAEYVNGQLQQTVDALRETAEERSRQIALLKVEVERLRTGVADAVQARAVLAAHEARPHWLRIARELTPPPLRDRAGAALHRARRMIRS